MFNLFRKKWIVVAYDGSGSCDYRSEYGRYITKRTPEMECNHLNIIALTHDYLVRYRIEGVL